MGEVVLDKICSCGSLGALRKDNEVRCKKCDNALYYSKNRQKIAIRGKEYCNTNKEIITIRNKEWYAQSRIKEPLYKTWKSIISRCHNPNDEKYPNWGAKGVIVAEVWRNSFEDFKETILSTIGPRPGLEYSLDRYPDRNGNYEPGNLRWATAKEQQNNKRNNLNYRLSIPDDSPIYYPYNVLTTLKEFAEQVDMFLIIAKYRYALSFSYEYILDDKQDNRYYKYRKHKYSIPELAIIAGITYKKMFQRIVRYKWSIERSVETL